jgi:hypothetical protein
MEMQIDVDKQLEMETHLDKHPDMEVQTDVDKQLKMETDLDKHPKMETQIDIREGTEDRDGSGQAPEDGDANCYCRSN